MCPNTHFSSLKSEKASEVGGSDKNSDTQIKVRTRLLEIFKKCYLVYFLSFNFINQCFKLKH